MEESILKSTKKILGLEENYAAFDLDVLTHINAAFSILHELGIGPANGLFVEDDSIDWSAFTDVPEAQLPLVKTYVYLKVRLLFDPPTTSFLIDAAQKQVNEYEWRLSTMREVESMPTDERELLDELARNDRRLYRQLHSASEDIFG